MDHSAHSLYSSYREALIEHLFVGQLLTYAWLKGPIPIEVMKPQVDDSGYDLVIECHNVVRHIQLKSSFIGSRTSKQTIHLRMADKPCGCIIWVYFSADTLELGPFLFFGGKPGEPLPVLTDLKIARHTKADSSGYKSERQSHRIVPKKNFQRFGTLEELWVALFGTETNQP